LSYSFTGPVVCLIEQAILELRSESVLGGDLCALLLTEQYASNGTV